MNGHHYSQHQQHHASTAAAAAAAAADTATSDDAGDSEYGNSSTASAGGAAAIAAAAAEAAALQSLANSRLDHRSTRERALLLTLGGPEGAGAPPEALNEKAIAVIRRVQDKLTGRDFGNAAPHCVEEQVDRLIRQATLNENLCQLFTG
jgi:FATC domain